MKKIKSALISVYHKDRLDEIVDLFSKLNIQIFSTGGTFNFIEKLGVKAVKVEDLTSYPSILGGRVKTLHPKVFGGILARRNNEEDLVQLETYDIPEIDLVIVDLYPFEETVVSNSDEQEIIEKIDIGGISLIRAAAKNYKDVLIISAQNQYNDLIKLLKTENGFTSIEDRKQFATKAFDVSSHYDTAIYNYFAGWGRESFKASESGSKELRYGENPHQRAKYYGHIEEVFTQLHGKEISYNNLGDIESAISLIEEFDTTTFAILKHNNACGLASRNKLVEAWKDALAGDPLSAFGGVLITNAKVDEETAVEINKLFFEVILAPDYEENALTILKKKKNRIILQKSSYDFPEIQFKSMLNGIIAQDKDSKIETEEDLRSVTKKNPDAGEIQDLIFANKIVKQTKSNTIVLAKNGQLMASGVGQTSRVDALKQAVEKANSFGFDLKGAVMASDAFFPFADSVELAFNAGILAVVQPGGSVRDQDSVDFCNEHGMSMVFTGVRHFKH